MTELRQADQSRVNFRYDGPIEGLMKALHNLDPNKETEEALPENTVGVTHPLYRKTLRGMDLANQGWIKEYRSQLKRARIYHTVGNVVKTPLRLLRLFGHKQPSHDVYTAGRDVSFYLRPKIA